MVRSLISDGEKGNGDGLQGAPWWAKAGVRVGLPAIGMGFLLWWMTTGFSSTMTATATTATATRSVVESNQKGIASLAEAIAAHQRSMDDAVKVESAEIASFLRMICVNTSRGEADRAACLQRR